MVDFVALAAPFLADEVYWRLGSVSAAKKRGQALAYIDARVVMDRLDDVCGPEGWQDRYPHAHAKTVCDIGIKCGDEWVWKADGAGDSDIEAEKGSLSDAFKRAAVRWGIGRYLYHIKSPWVEVEDTGRKNRKGEPIWEFSAAAKKELAQIAQRASGAPVAPMPSQSSAHGRALAADEPHLIDHTRKKGTLSAAATAAGFGRPPTVEEARKAKIKAGADKRINALATRNDWTRSELDQFWKENDEWISWMADPNNKAMVDYQRFTDAFANAEVNMKEVA